MMEGRKKGMEKGREGGREGGTVVCVLYYFRGDTQECMLYGILFFHIGQLGHSGLENFYFLPTHNQKVT